MPDPDPHVLNVIAEDATGLAAELRPLGEILWLSERRAFDLVPAEDARAAFDVASEAAKGVAADVNLVALPDRRKKLLVADMDSTIIGCECLDELADMAHIRPQVAAITERAMRGDIEFVPALRERVALLKGLPLAALERVYRERVRLNPGAKALVATMRANGAHTLLVSGGFTYFTRRVADAAGFQSEQANRLLDDGVHLLGTVAEPVLGREAKLRALIDTAHAMGLSLDETLAVGDGANDLDMIRRAGLGVAFHAKPVVAAAAGARITHGDLTALLYLQGYREEEIVKS